MITDKNTLKSWFKRGLKPLASQFADWIDSYWHKDEPIALNAVEGLEEILNSKAEDNALTAHLVATNNPHSVTKAQIGLSNADDTADKDKPVSDAMRDEITQLYQEIAEHDQSPASHPDIHNALTNIENGTIIVGRAAYADRLGSAADSYTKTQLDAKINKHLKNVTYNPVNAVFTFIFQDDTTIEIDTPVEHTVKSGHYDDTTKELVLILISGDEIRIPAAGLIKVYSGAETPTTAANVTTEGKISVDIKQGVIDTVHLSETLKAQINAHPATHPATMIVEDATHRFITDGERSAWNGKADPNHTHAAEDITEDMAHRFITTLERVQWNSKAEGEHTHAAYKILDDTDHRFITDNERAAWNAKADGYHIHPAGQITEDGTHRFITDAERAAWNTNTSYTHPATHPATIIIEDTAHRFITDGERTAWNGKAEGYHIHPAGQITEDGTHRFITDAERTAWNGKANANHGHETYLDKMNPEQQTISGYVNFAAGAGSTSDIRFKDNIKPLPDLLPILQTLDLFAYRWNKPGEIHNSIGLSAQQLREHFPELVHEADDNDHTLSVQYDKLVIIALQAIKELQKQIDRLT